MYSPKIREDLIPIIYRQSKRKAKTMTRFIDEILRPLLIDIEKSNKGEKDNENGNIINKVDNENEEERYCCKNCKMQIEVTDRKIGYCEICECEVFVEKI